MIRTASSTDLNRECRSFIVFEELVKLLSYGFLVLGRRQPRGPYGVREIGQIEGLLRSGAQDAVDALNLYLAFYVLQYQALP